MAYSAELLSSRLDRLRKARGLTHQQVADASGLDLPLVRRLLTGQTLKPTFEDVIRLGTALGLTPAETAALGDLWVLTGKEASMLSDPVAQAISHFQNYLLSLDYEERLKLIELFELSIQVHRRSQQQKPVENDRLLDQIISSTSGSPSDDQ